MTFLPIVGRELRVAARRRGTYWTRLGMAAGACAIGGSILFFFALGVPAQQVGAAIFRGLAGLSLLYCLTYGRQATADCLSLEKREGTLGLLFLTDLKGHDIVLGKLAATSLGGFYGLMAIFPMLAVPLLMGGITSGEFWRVVLVLMDTFLFSLAAGMFVSAVSREARRALAANFFLVFLLIAVPPAVAGLLVVFGSTPVLARELFLSCPVYSFYLCFDAAYKLNPDQFWKSVALIHGLTWLMLALASRIVPYTWRDQPEPAGKPTWRGRWRAWSYGGVSSQKAFRKRLLEVNAFYWLAARARLKPLHVWTFLLFMLGWWLVGWASAGALWFDAAVYVLTSLLLNTTLKLWLLLEAGQRLAEEHRAGTLELLLSTPLGVKDILRGQWLALRRQFAAPLLAVTALELIFLRSLYLRSHDLQMVAVWIAGLLMLAADVLALGWVAMWLALRAKSHHHAIVGTVTRVLVLPWLLFGMISGLINLWSSFATGVSWAPTWKFNLGLWFGLGLGCDITFGLVARRKLRTRFRLLALQRFSRAPSRSLFLPPRSKHPQPRPGSVRPAFQHTSRVAWILARVSGRKPAFLMGLVLGLLGVSLYWAFRPTKPSLPAPVVVALSLSNAPLRVFPAGSGVFMILPDGSLWRWGRANAAGSALPMPTQVGTNCNWRKAIGTFTQSVGIRADGTLWEWRPGNDPSAPPMQVGSGQDWVDVGGFAGYVVALRKDGTLWEWGASVPGMAKGGGTLSLTQSAPSQIGTNHDWAAVSSYGYWSSVLALRTDGTLWLWGQVYSLAGTGGGVTGVSTVPDPTRLCLETNWAGFIECYPAMARTSAGEAWELSGRPPNPEVPAAAVCYLIASNTVPGRFTSAYGGERMLYEIRADGTLWQRTCPVGPQFTAAPGKWRQVGRRSDWVSLQGAGATALGMTADGTLWMWGYDPTRSPPPNLFSALRAIQTRIGAAFSGRAVTFGAAYRPFIQKEPRPLMRLVPAPAPQPSARY